MTTQDFQVAEQARTKRLRFDRYLLDLDRGCLFVEGNELALRPKTFAILLYLVEHPGRLVSKDELLSAVWPNLAITDDALVQSIGELRRALGDDGPRLIRTIPRRGYRLESDVSADVSMAQAPADAVPPSAASGDVGRPSKPVIGPRMALRASFAVAVLFAAGVLATGVATDWKFLNALTPRDQIASGLPKNGAKPAMAVLPLTDQSDDLSHEYFADGLTQDVINALGRFSALTVISWNGVLPYKGKPASPADIGKTLGVGYLVEGSVRRNGDRVRVIAQLVDTRKGRVLWSARFDDALADVFALQDRMTAQIVGALAIHVEQIEQQRVFAKPTESLEAYDYVLRARPALQRPTRIDSVTARSLLRRAIKLDPSYAAAYAGLAESYYIATSMGWAESPTAFLSRAEEMANKALSLNNSEVRAHIILGRIHIFYHRYEQAKAEMDRAIAINPNDAHGLAGRGNILMWLGQTDAAIQGLELAQRIDPGLNAMDRFALSLAYYLKRHYGAAVEQAERNLRAIEGAKFNRVVLAAAYAELNRSEDAARVVAVIHRTDPTFDPQEFGTKLSNPADLASLRDGLRKAGLYRAQGTRGLTKGN
jgi:adenylate cyclase